MVIELCEECVLCVVEMVGGVFVCDELKILVDYVVEVVFGCVVVDVFLWCWCVGCW